MVGVIASTAGVDVSAVSMTVTAGSVDITAIILTTYETQTPVLTAITGAVDTDAERATFFSSVSGGGVPLIQVGTQTTFVYLVVYPPSSPPSPPMPSPPADDDSGNGGLIGGIIGGICGPLFGIIGYI
eukprot:5122303-Prymnesium_polylepis.1